MEANNDVFCLPGGLNCLSDKTRQSDVTAENESEREAEEGEGPRELCQETTQKLESKSPDKNEKVPLIFMPI